MKIKNRKKEKQIGKIFLIGILALFLMPFVSSVYSSSNTAYTSPGLSSTQYMNTQGINIFPIIDKDKCGAGQDFVLQISPTGCTPSVVRSDLLEEQNVPVFCPIYATKVNPLIEVDSIKHISFEGVNYPSGVAGIGFHPAQAALSSSEIPLTSSIFGNIGYAVIVLKKQKNESSMQDYVQGTITARIVTDVENAIGAGNIQYQVSEINDDDWNSNYKQYGFWKGKGYIRADSIDEKGAVISVYRDKESVLSTRVLKEGETSTDIFLPGYYCPARFNIKLDKINIPESYARIDLNGDIFDISEGEDFFDNKCQIRNMEKIGIVEKISVQCTGDEKTEKFDLIYSPKIKLSIDDIVGEYEVGQRIYTSDDVNKNVYLGAAFLENSNEPDSLRIYLAKLPIHKDKLTDDELKSIFNTAKLLQKAKIKEAGIVNVPGKLIQGYIGSGTNILKWIFEGESLIYINNKKFHNVWGKQISIVSFGEPINKQINQDFKANFEKAETTYRQLLNGFPNEKISEISEETYAENGFIELIELAERTEQKAKMKELCEEFNEKYPNSADKIKDICDNSLKNANSEISTAEVLINGKIRTISFEGIYEPTYEQLGALIQIENSANDGNYEMTKSQDIALSSNEYFTLKEIGENYVVISSNVEEGLKLNYDPDNIKIELNDYKVIGKNDYKISINQINLKKSAKVKILSHMENTETKANFTFKIGIEKRAIQLSPEKTKSRIENLNEQINKWENISGKLEKTVSTMTKACFATNAFLTLKNTFANSGLNSIARQKVMRDDGGWFDLCTKEVSEGKSASVDSCLYKNADAIDNDVSKMAGIMKTQNEQIKTIQKNNMEDTLIGEMVNEDKYVSEYIPEVKTNLANSGLSNDELNKLNIVLTTENFKAGSFDKDDLRDMQLNSQILNSDASLELKAIAKQNLQKTISLIEKTSEKFIETKNFANSLGISPEKIPFLEIGKDSKKLKYEGLKLSDISKIFPNPSIDTNTPVSVLQGSDGGKYIIILDNSIGGDIFPIKKEGESLQIYDENGNVISNPPEELKKIYFQKFDSTSYKNKIVDAKIKYFETVPYKGYPAIVPFDVENGWYAAIKQTLPGNLRAYDESGKVVSYYLCNVGENGKAEFDSGIGDDNCEGINTQTKQTYNQFPGLDSSETIKLTNNAMRAIEDAQRGYRSGVTSVNIRGKMVSVGSPMASIPEIQCQDFMSPKDCHLMFNICDPVMCPSSRCNLGGAYNVDNVAQSGIIGSIALCLPNYKEKILIPVCLTGIKNGIDGLLSMTKSYRDCLQESLDTGKTVGICDEIQSIYLCELAWREAAPFANLGIPKLLSIIFGQGTHGGGEYLGIASAWTKVQDSTTFFTQYYGVNAYKAFKARSTSDVGSELCKVFISMKSPNNIIDALSTPDSPVQYTSWFNEIPFTTATNPPISQYKVFYHIYAGQNEGAYYKVYLKSPTGSSLYQQNPTILVAQGYVEIGGQATETKDFTAASDYKELCVSINAQEECGFKEVSTSFAAEYIKEKYIESQASKTDIKKEKDCVSSSAYNYGVVRICATDNPGLGTDAKANVVGSRWIGVGYCDDEDMKCWLDTQSVKNVIDIQTIENATLSEVTSNYVDSLINKAGFLSESDYKKERDRLKDIIGTKVNDGSSDNDKLISSIETIESIYEKILIINEKAELLNFEARAYNKIARNLFKINQNYINIKKFEGSEKCGAAIDYDYYNAPTTTGNSYMLCNSGTASAVKLSKDGTRWEWTCDGEPCYAAKTGASVTTDFTKITDLPNPTLINRITNKNLLDNLSLYDNIISTNAQKNSVEKNLIKAIITQESMGDKEVTDGLGSWGLMQISKAAATDVGLGDEFEKSKIDPTYNIQVGTAYYKKLYNYYSPFNSADDAKKMALAAYNWGIGNVNKNCKDKKWTNCKNVPPQVLQYVSNILAYERAFSGEKTEDILKDWEITGTETQISNANLIGDMKIQQIRKFWPDKTLDSLTLPILDNIVLRVSRSGEDLQKNPTKSIKFTMVIKDKNKKLIDTLGRAKAGDYNDMKSIANIKINVGEIQDKIVANTPNIEFLFILKDANTDYFKNAKVGDIYYYEIIAERDNLIDVKTGNIKILEGVKETCSDCGKGWNNICDKEECENIGEKLRIICEFQGNTRTNAGGVCVEKKTTITNAGQTTSTSVYTLGTKDADGYANILKNGEDTGFELGGINVIRLKTKNSVGSYNEGKISFFNKDVISKESNANELLNVAKDLENNYLFKDGKFVKKS